MMADNNLDPYIAQRKAMVEEQIIARGIKTPEVIQAMLTVPRHLFMPKDLVASAYEDRALAIGYEQTISQPYIVAFMTEALCLKGNEKILEIGTGSGYQSAVLAEIANVIYTTEIVAPLADIAKRRFAELHYSNIVSKYGDGYNGWQEYAPFDAIIVTCAPDHIPKALKQQLQTNGKMIIPVGRPWSTQYLITLTKLPDGRIVEEKVLGVRFVPMTGELKPL